MSPVYETEILVKSHINAYKNTTQAAEHIQMQVAEAKWAIVFWDCRLQVHLSHTPSQLL